MVMITDRLKPKSTLALLGILCLLVPAVVSSARSAVYAQDVTQTVKTGTQQDTAESSSYKENHPATPGHTLFETVKKGGPVMVPIILCGIVGLTLVIERLIFFTRRRTWYFSGLSEYLESVAAKSHARFREEMSDDLREAFQLYLNEMERGLSFLQGIGNIAPLLGFLGTVTGMINAFSAIAAATTVNARIVAVGIQQALITTAAGLMIAAPATFCYYIFLHVIHQRFVQAEAIIERLCGNLPRLSDSLDTDEDNQ